MNAAFLLMTTAWLAGADAPPAAAPAPAPAPAPTPGGTVTPAPYAGGAYTGGAYTGGAYAGGGCCGGGSGATYGGCGGCGCENTWCEKQGLFSRLKGCFSKHNDCCNTCDTCNTCNTCNTGCGNTGCGNTGCGKGGFFGGGFGGKHHNDCCAPTCQTCAPTCQTCAPVYSSCNTCNTCNTGNTCGSSCCDSCSSGGLFSRLKGRFSKHNDCCYTPSCGCNTGCPGGGCGAPYGGAIAPVTPGAGAEKIPAPVGATPDSKKLPSDSTPPAPAPAPKETSVPGINLTPTAEPETKSPFELSRRYQARADRAADSSWLTGELFFVHADGGLWVLRYAPLSKEDPYGGGVVLARDHRMDSYREGDLVTVKGEIIANRASSHLGAPLYRFSTIQLLDRSRPAE